MAKENTYLAVWNGKVIGKRRSSRPYTHAIIVQDSIDTARYQAYAYEATMIDKSNFDYNAEIAAMEAWPEVAYRRQAITREQIDEAKAMIAGGWEGYLGRLREAAIKRFEDKVASGLFEPFVFGWSMSKVNATKMAAGCGKSPEYRLLLGVVEAKVKEVAA
jgi:hypothetical protein